MNPSVPASHAHLPHPHGRGATLREVFAATTVDAAATGFALAHLPPGARVLWVQDRPSRREGGRPYAPALGIDLLHLEVPRARDALWAMEQALGCPALAAVVGEVWGEPPALDFTATKRLALRAEASGVAAWLLRGTASPDLSAARERWRVVSLEAGARGGPVWHANLFRARDRRPADWVVTHDRARRRLAFDPASSGAAATNEGAAERAAADGAALGGSGGPGPASKPVAA